MGNTLFDARCASPAYALESEQVASNCGKYSGYIAAGVLSTIVLIIALAVYFSPKKEPDGTPKKKDPMVFVYALIAIVFFVVALPLINSFFSKRRYQSAQYTLDGYTRNGMSRSDAIKEMTQLQQAQATSSAGTDIASALLMSSMMNNNRN